MEFAQSVMRLRWWAVVSVLFALQIGVTLLIAFYSRPSAVNVLYWSVAPALVAVAVFGGIRARLMGFVLLWPLFIPAAIAAELLAHAVGACVQ